MHACIHADTHAHTRTYLYTRTCATCRRAQAPIHPYTHTQISAYIHAYIQFHVGAYKHACIHTYVLCVGLHYVTFEN